MPQPVAPPSTFGDDRLAVGYQLKTHLVGISPQISRHVRVRGDTTPAELHQENQRLTRKYDKLNPLGNLVANFHTYCRAEQWVHCGLRRTPSLRGTRFHQLCGVDGGPGAGQAPGEAATDAVDQKRRSPARAGPHQGAQRGVGGLFSATISRLPAITGKTGADGRLARLPHTF